MKKGFDVDVYERHKGRSDIGGGIICWPNAYFLLNEISMLGGIVFYSKMTVKDECLFMLLALIVSTVQVIIKMELCWRNEALRSKKS